MQVLQSCARYAETRLRFLAKEGQIEDKTEVLAVAQIKYLQEEFGQLNVAKGFGEDTFNVFRMLRRNTNYFASPGVLEALKAAVSFASQRGGHTSRGRGGYSNMGQRL